MSSRAATQVAGMSSMPRDYSLSRATWSPTSGTAGRRTGQHEVGSAHTRDARRWRGAVRELQWLNRHPVPDAARRVSDGDSDEAVAVIIRADDHGWPLRTAVPSSHLEASALPHYRSPIPDVGRRAACCCAARYAAMPEYIA